MLILQLFVMVAILLAGQEQKKEAASPSVKFDGRVSELSIPDKYLEGNWFGPTGLVVNNLNDLSDVPAEQRPLVEPLKAEFVKIGVVGMADFTYRKDSNVMHQVTVRVFVFDNEESCRKWWKTKYEYDGWEKHYTKVKDVPYALWIARRQPSGWWRLETCG